MAISPQKADSGGVMTSLRDRSNRLRPKSRGRVLSFLGVLSLLVIPITAPKAGATDPQPTVGMYLDQPFVQGSYVAEDFSADSVVTTFNDQIFGSTCSFNGATIEPLYSASADCHIQTNVHFGGASTTSSTPVAGQTANPINYGQVGSGGASIVFDTPQTYFGLWWSAGSTGNEIQLFNGTQLVANTSANDVASTLFSSGTITAQSGASYATRLYIGNPVDWYTVGSPSDFADEDADNSYQSHYTLAQEPFVYIHFIAADGVTFDRVDLIAPGNGYEFDNFTTSTATGIRAAGIPNRLVLQRELYEPNYVDFDPNGGTGALPRQYSVDSQAGYLQSSCMDYYDPSRCIYTLNDSYSTWQTGWNTEPDGTGDSYDFGSLYPFTVNQTLYAQWQSQFSFYNLTNPDANASNAWDFVDWDTVTYPSITNLGDFTLPAPERANQYLEGWYSYDRTYTQLIRVGGPGDVVSASTYTTWDLNIFGRWLDNPATSVDAAAPEILLVYPKASSVELPSMPLVGDVVAAICLVESDSSGNQISSNLQFTDLANSSSGFSASYSISASEALVGASSRYLRLTVSASSDTACSSGTTHIIEIRPLAAAITNVLPLYLTER